MWQPERIRRWMLWRTEQSGWLPARASRRAQALSRITCASLTKLRCSSRPGEQDDEPVLQEQSNELGIQFTEDPPLVRRSPFINPSVLLPQLVEHLHLPPFPQEHKSFLETEQVNRRIRVLTAVYNCAQIKLTTPRYGSSL